MTVGQQQCRANAYTFSRCRFAIDHLIGVSGCKSYSNVQTSKICCNNSSPISQSSGEGRSDQFSTHCSSFLMLSMLAKRRNMMSSLFFFSCHILLFSGLVLPVIAESALVPTWDSEPSDRAQYRGLSATIDCRVRDLGGRLITWSKIINLETKILFINDNRFDAPDRYQSVPFQGGTAEGYQLVLTDLLEEDDAQYVCQVQQSLKKAAHLTVLGKLNFN